MKNKVLFFSIDRLGDYLIRSNVIKKISERFDNVEIVSSDKNYKLISIQTFFNKVYLLNTKKKFIEKIKLIFLFFLRRYDAIIVFDGKNISNILLFLVRSNFKYTFVYKKKKFSNLIYIKFITFIYDLFNIKYEFLYNRANIENNFSDNYPEKYKKLKKYFSNINDETYFLEKTQDKKNDIISGEYILIHLDEKFCDIKDVNLKLEKTIISFQKKINKKVILTSFNNDHEYYKNLSFKRFYFEDLDYTKIKNLEVLIIENIKINYFQNLIENSMINISCHSGLFVHISLALDKRTIDIINEADEKWLNAWIDNKKSYERIIKSNNSQLFSVNEIFLNVYEKIK